MSRLAVFGSVARGSDREGSDIDILVEFDRAPGFDAFMDLKYYLEDLLGVPVDLVTRKALRPRIRKHVEREAIDVA
ncbi:MAG: nucleotidyltransferase family protein [Polyangia bacterium]